MYLSLKQNSGFSKAVHGRAERHLQFVCIRRLNTVVHAGDQDATILSDKLAH